MLSGPAPPYRRLRSAGYAARHPIARKAAVLLDSLDLQRLGVDHWVFVNQPSSQLVLEIASAA
jgi:hypothetical protein